MSKRENKESNPSYYAIIPAGVRYNNAICANAKLLYGEITALCNKEGYCWASNQYFASLYNVHKNTISKWVSELVSEGYIVFNVQDDNKRTIYLVGYKQNRVYPKRKAEGGINEIAYTPKRKAEHNNTYNSTTNNVSTNVTRQAGDPMSLFEFIDWCKKSQQKHIQVIGEWAEGEQPKHSTYGEWQSFIKRNLRPAKELAPYPIEKIERAYNLMSKDIERKLPSGKKEGFITKYSLETVLKYIDKV